MVRHTFFYWIDRYYAATDSYIAVRQQSDPLIWKDLVGLVESLRRQRAKALGVSSLPPPTPEQIQAFLLEEQTVG